MIDVRRSSLVLGTGHGRTTTVRYMMTGLGGALAVAFAATPANAQDERRFDIKLSGSALYDSNIARSDEARAAQRGLVREDVRFTPSVAVDILRPLGRQSVFLSGSTGYDFHRRNKRLDRERIDLTGGATTRISICQATWSGRYARRQSNLDDLGTVLVRNVEETKTLGVDASCLRPVGIGPTLSVYQTWSDNSAPVRTSSDYESFNVTPGIAYNRPAFGNLAVYGQYTKAKFPKRLRVVGLETLTDGYEVYAGGVRYERNIGARLGGAVAAAYTSVHSQLPGISDFSGLTYAFDLNYKPSERLKTKFSLERDVKPSNRLDVTYDVASLYRLEADYALGSRLTLNGGGAVRKRDYKAAALVPGAFSGNERITTFFASARFRPRPSLSFLLDGAHEKKKSDNPLFNYKSVRAGISSVLEF